MATSERMWAEALFTGQSHVLEQIATGAPLPEVLEEIARRIEAQAPDSLCSILLLDDARQRLWVAAAPSLPVAYNRSIDGAPIGAKAGSCGTAAYRGETVIVADIATDPLWAEFRHLALPHGLRACWSSPILSSQGAVLGTFALYYRIPRGPTANEAQSVTRWAHLVGLAIEREQNERRLRERAEEIQALLETLPVGVLIAHDPEARKITGNRVAQGMLRVPAGANVSKSAPPTERTGSYEVFRGGRQLSPHELPVQRAARGERVWQEELLLLFEDGSVRHELVSAAPLFDARGHLRGAVAAMLDMTERKLAAEALYAEKVRAQVTLASIADAVIATDATGTVEYLNPVAEALTGWPLQEAVGRPLPEVFAIVNEYTREVAPDPVTRCLAEGQAVRQADHDVLTGRHGIEYAIEGLASPIRDPLGRVLGVVLVFHDVTEQRRLTSQISYQATHDMLTGLVNRHEFELRLARAIDSTHADHGEHVLCYLDLDQFKVVNDTCGHIAGDQLLRQLAAVLSARIRQRDTLARLGGDEFGLLLEHCSLEQGKRIADALRVAVEEFRFVWEDRSFRLGVSIGLVPIDAAVGNQAAVLQAADSACYVAKDGGRNRVHVHDAQDEDLARRQGEMQWIGRIQEALEENRFRLYAQQIFPVCADGTSTVHCELLLRLVDDSGGMLLPGAFMPAAERYHLAPRIDRWVVDQAFQWLAGNPRWLSRLKLCAINLSGQSLCDPLLQAEVLRQLDAWSLPAGKICFEVTETAAIANLTDAIRFIKALRARGCRFALDDFGSGHSSFAYLKNLPVEYLKIDGVFVKDIAEDPIDLAVVRSINEIGQLMGKQTIAEYVENDAILERLREVGVDYAQGYGLGLPQPLEDLLAEP